MKRLLIVACLFASSSAFATTAFWTGNKEQLQSEQGEVNKKQPQSEQAATNKEQPQPEQGETSKAQPQPEKIATKWTCEYRVAYTTQMILVWRTFPDYCPAEIELESEGGS
jgi:hypothetical protein